jgi:hypothetical protein
MTGSRRAVSNKAVIANFFIIVCSGLTIRVNDPAPIDSRLQLLRHRGVRCSPMVRRAVFH